MNPTAMCRALFIACAVCLAAPTLHAATPQGDEQAAATYERGRGAFKEGRYAEAAEAFTAAYDHFKDKNILWNLGIALERAGELAAARDRFKAFLAHDDVDAGLRSEAADALLRVGGKLSAREAAKTPAERIAVFQRERAEAEAAGHRELMVRLDDLIAAERQAEAAARPVDVPDPGAVGHVANPGPGPASEGGGPGAESWILLGAGGAVIAAGVVMFFVGESKFSEIEDAHAAAGDGLVTSLSRQEALDLESDGATFQTLGAIGMGVGAAALATGIVLLALDDGGPVTDQRVDVGLAPMPGGFDFRLATHF